MAFHYIVSRFAKLLQVGFVLLLLLMENTQARIGYFWHITDLHLDTIYSTQGDVLRSCWRIEPQSQSSSPRSPGHFGDYLCDSPWSLIESAAKAMKSRQGDNVEFVLWTGDGLSHSAHPMAESRKMEILRNITDLLGRTFLSQFVFPVLGHEDGTTTNFRHMGELWRHWLPSEALHTFEKGGYYSIEQTKSRLRIIALNTNFMRHDPKYSQSHLAAVRQRTPPNSMMGGTETSEYKNYYYHHGQLRQHHGHGGDWSALGYGYNGHHRGIGAIPGMINNAAAGADKGGVGGASDGSGGRVSALSEYENQDTEKQWIWLEDVLSKSKNNKETVYIVGHIPPGSDERHIGLQQNGHTTFTESNNKRYLDLVRKYSSIIQGQFFGHLHSDSFRIIYDDKGKPVSWMMISPSVTPRKMSVGSNNPAMRLYKFDTDSGQVLDYTQYYMDLELANSMGEPNWVPEYNLTHYYALSEISAISLHNFVDHFTSSDDSWFAKYYRANTVRYVTDPCSSVCMLNHYCAITRIDYKEFRQCLEKERSALGSHAPSTTLNTSCPLLVLLCTLGVSCCRALLAVLPKVIARMERQLRRQIEFDDAITMIKIKSAAMVLLLLRVLSTGLPTKSQTRQMRKDEMHYSAVATTNLCGEYMQQRPMSAISKSPSLVALRPTVMKQLVLVIPNGGHSNKGSFLNGSVAVLVGYNNCSSSCSNNAVTTTTTPETKQHNKIFCSAVLYLNAIDSICVDEVQLSTNLLLTSHSHTSDCQQQQERKQQQICCHCITVQSQIIFHTIQLMKIRITLLHNLHSHFPVQACMKSKDSLVGRAANPIQFFEH